MKVWTSAVPARPGVYLFRDTSGRVIYVGKAKSLRSRVSSYFAAGLDPRTEAMVQASADVEWIVTDNEVEALHLELNLIKEHRPRFNVRYRDDKSYPYLAITLEKTGHSLEAKPHWRAYQTLSPNGEWVELAREFSE